MEEYKTEQITNRIIYGDNLTQLKKIPKESINLIYLDPPFFSGRNYEIIFGDEREHPGFTDIWKGKKNKEKRVGGIEVYKEFMKERLIECHRILKPTGTIFLHCDKHAAHHLRLMMDEIFRVKNFINEIIWNRALSTKQSQYAPKKFSVVTDTILLYAKSSKYFVDIERVYVELNEDELKKKYKFSDKHGIYRKGPILRSASMGKRPNLVYEYKGFKPERWGWRITKENLVNIDSKGNLGWTKKKTPFRKHRIEEEKGFPVGNLWVDIPNIVGSNSERLGYPTQKPEALLERIILAASNEGDLVLDPFCGCGTTLAVAKKLNRKYVGIDWSWIACKEIALRINQEERQIIRPIKLEDINKMDGFQAQRYICQILGAKSNPKEVGDKGINGWFPDGTAIQIKNSTIGSPTISQFTTDIKLHKGTKNNIGVVIGKEISKNAEENIVRIKQEFNIEIIPITIQEVLNLRFNKLENKIGHIKNSKEEWIWYNTTIKKMTTAIKEKAIQTTLD